MAQFPFAHTIEMTYRLRGGSLEVHTRIDNIGAQTMPLSVGYHPYFQLHDAPRDDWTVRLGAERVWTLSEKLIPTAETKPIQDVLGDAASLSLKGLFLDHVLGGLVRDDEGGASFSVEGARQKIEVVYGPKYRTAVVYAPTGKDQNFICFEPMSGITNAFNLAHRGIYKDLQTIPAGQAWGESYWIRPQRVLVIAAEDYSYPARFPKARTTLRPSPASGRPGRATPCRRLRCRKARRADHANPRASNCPSEWPCRSSGRRASARLLGRFLAPSSPQSMRLKSVALRFTMIVADSQLRPQGSEAPIF